jgi:hypothetical protein
MPSSPFQNRAGRVAKAVVPLGPAGRESPPPDSRRAAIPGLGDQRTLENRILPATVEKAAAFVEAMLLATENRGEIEAEAVHVHLAYPVAQLSVTICSTRGCDRFSVLPVPVSLM